MDICITPPEFLQMSLLKNSELQKNTQSSRFAAHTINFQNNPEFE